MKILTGFKSLIQNKKDNILIYVFLAIVTSIFSLIIFSPSIPQNITLQIGDMAQETIASPKLLEFQTKKDITLTNQQQKNIEQNIGKIYSINPKITKNIRNNINSFFSDLIMSETIKFYMKQIITAEEYTHLKSLTKEDLKKLKQALLIATNSILEKGIYETHLPSITNELNKQVDYNYTEAKKAGIKVIKFYIKPNIINNENQRLALLNQAKNSIKKVTTTIKKGEPIIYQNDIVNSYHIEIFKALQMYNKKTNLTQYFGIFILCFCALIILERFIYCFSNSFYSFKYISLVMLILLILILISRSLITLEFIPNHLSIYILVPISISAMLLSFLVTSKISIICGTFISLFASLIFSTSYEAFIFLFLSNCITTFIIFNSYKRSDVIVCGYIIGLFNVIIILGIGLFTKEASYMWYSINSIFGFLNGIISSMITLAILPYFESIFKITTNQTLLELSNLNHPILKRLMLNAPGTYQHSLMVSNLAEAAAETIQANTILCRVGSYFHDIGKLKRPIFFSENQFSESNPHDTLSPRISKLIIISHVKDGVELSKKHKLPKVLQDIIEQHHGTSLLSIFYSHAKADEGNNISTDDEFRYLGPKPQTKEAGIIMLADSVEAATKSLEKPNPQKIQNIIDKVFKSKLDDLQLSECPLSLNEIYMIKSSFLYLFKGMYHNRVDYSSELKSFENSTKQKPDSNSKKTNE